MTEKQKQERAVLVDEFGELDRQVAQFKPTADRHKALREAIAAWFDGEDAQKEFLAEGTLYVVPISPRKKERKILSIAKLFKRLGREVFLRIAQIRLKDVDELLPAAEHKTYLGEEYTGSRTVGRAVAKIPLAKAKLPKAA